MKIAMFCFLGIANMFENVLTTFIRNYQRLMGSSASWRTPHWRRLHRPHWTTRSWTHPSRRKVHATPLSRAPSSNWSFNLKWRRHKLVSEEVTTLFFGADVGITWGSMVYFTKSYVLNGWELTIHTSICQVKICKWYQLGQLRQYFKNREFLCISRMPFYKSF